jgi:hypothetical protein
MGITQDISHQKTPPRGWFNERSSETILSLWRQDPCADVPLLALKHTPSSPQRNPFFSKIKIATRPHEIFAKL